MSPNPRHPLEDLSAYLDGELEPAARADLETHLAGCDSCAAVLDDLRFMADAGGGEAPPVPEGLAERIASRLDRSAAGGVPPRRSRRLVFGGPVLTLAASLAAAGILWVIWQNSAPAPVPAPAPEAAREVRAPEMESGYLWDEDAAGDKKDEQEAGLPRSAGVPPAAARPAPPPSEPEPAARPPATRQEALAPRDSAAAPALPPERAARSEEVQQLSAPRATLVLSGLDSRPAGDTPPPEEGAATDEGRRQRLSRSAVAGQAAPQAKVAGEGRVLTLVEPLRTIRLQEDGRLDVRVGDYRCGVAGPGDEGEDGAVEARRFMNEMLLIATRVSQDAGQVSLDPGHRGLLLSLVREHYLDALSQACGPPPPELLQTPD